MKKATVAAAAACILAAGAGHAAAQQAAAISSSLGVIPYPSKGQTPEHQAKDEGECYAWAKQQTGIDPVAVASAPPTKGS